MVFSRRMNDERMYLQQRVGVGGFGHSEKELQPCLEDIISLRPVLLYDMEMCGWNVLVDNIVLVRNSCIWDDKWPS
jgi:hypothetical protein